MVNNSLIDRPARVVFMRKNKPAAYYAHSIRAIMESYTSHSYYKIISVDPLYREVNEQILAPNTILNNDAFKCKVFINDIVMWHSSSYIEEFFAVEYDLSGDVQYRIVTTNEIIPKHLVNWNKCKLIGSVYEANVIGIQSIFNDF